MSRTKRYAQRGLPRAFLDKVKIVRTDECVDWPFGLSKGYPSIQADGKPCIATRVLLTELVGPPPPLYEACHSCGNRKCVNPAHLRWGSRKDNAADKLIHGTDARGAKSTNTPLTNADVREIRRIGRDKTTVELGAMYGVHKNTICKIINRQTWQTPESEPDLNEQFPTVRGGCE